MFKGDQIISKQDLYAEQMLQMYASFDEFSGYRFHDAVESAKQRLVFDNAVNTRKWDIILDKSNKRYLSELPLRDKAYLWLMKTKKNQIAK